MADSPEHHVSPPSHIESDSTPLKINPYKELRPQLSGNAAEVLADLNDGSDQSSEAPDTLDE